MSEAEEALAFQLRGVGVPFEREVLFARKFKRRWRADFVVKPFPGPIALSYGFPSQISPLMVEIDGGTWTGGRHVTGRGHAADAEKRNAAVLLGYRPLTFTPAQIEDGSALKTIESALGLASGNER